MKGKIIFFSLFFLLVAGSVSAQNKNLPKSIISTTASIRQYYDQKELNGMQKGELLELYIERIKVLVKILPYVALATKPGITMADLGIPDDAEHRKSLDLQSESTSNFLTTTVDFQRKMMPYSDKSNLIASILFYQNTLKELHVFNEL
ncbi:hypothetical protein DR871_004395 [Flavobacterium petrolei]|jgi:hypothetical protein|uniref:Uncharacterized protein n=1 Tax=Flavobacterium petrolei TaxID=2259594 RepID=A0A482U0H5_9FLAO|nr:MULTISPECIES: hypothetical protein [Flavobacterium]QIH38999.1 hypothetical protein G7A72_09360 [Flavobacterium sp. Sr18]RYJ53296.1 hypothetical protein DR871_004395 [Flavobacterium petrolei]